MAAVDIDIIDNKFVFKYLDIDIMFRYDEIQQNQIMISPMSYPIAHHVWRVIKSTFPIMELNDINNIPKVIDEIKRIIAQGYTSLCTICGIDIGIQHNISSCKKCLDKFMITNTDNIITKNYNYDPLCVILLIRIAIECLRSQRNHTIFVPLPKIYDNFVILHEITKEYDETKFKNIMETCSDDNELYEKIGYLYGFIKYVIASNKTRIKSEKVLKGDKLFETDDCLLIDDKTKFIDIRIIHDDETEKKFRTKIPYFLVHGSPFENWYSIMRNGLKNYSGTNKMLNGQAFGSGIYLSDSFSFSHNYSKMGDYRNKNMNTENKLYIVGVVQLLDEPINYKKAANTYVVPDDKKIILRNMIITNGTYINGIQEQIMEKRVGEIMSYFSNLNFILTKRINQEEKFMNKFIENENLKLKLNINGDVWILKHDNFDIEITLPINYPTIPPKIRIINCHKFCVQNNVYIDKDGNVMLPEMDHLIWNSRTKLVDLIKHLLRVL